MEGFKDDLKKKVLEFCNDYEIDLPNEERASAAIEYLFEGGSGLGGAAQNGDIIPVTRRLQYLGFSSSVFESKEDFFNFTDQLKNEIQDHFSNPEEENKYHP